MVVPLKKQKYPRLESLTWLYQINSVNLITWLKKKQQRYMDQTKK